jgi:hypothetical protein
MLTSYGEEIIGDHQRGFRRNWSNIDNIFCFRQIHDKIWNNKAVHQPFTGFKKAYDSVRREVCVLLHFSLVFQLNW